MIVGVIKSVVERASCKLNENLVELNNKPDWVTEGRPIKRPKAAPLSFKRANSQELAPVRLVCVQHLVHGGSPLLIGIVVSYFLFCSAWQ